MSEVEWDVRSYRWYSRVLHPGWHSSPMFLEALFNCISGCDVHLLSLEFIDECEVTKLIPHHIVRIEHHEDLSYTIYIIFDFLCYSFSNWAVDHSQVVNSSFEDGPELHLDLVSCTLMKFHLSWKQGFLAIYILLLMHQSYCPLLLHGVSKSDCLFIRAIPNSYRLTWLLKR